MEPKESFYREQVAAPTALSPFLPIPRIKWLNRFQPYQRICGASIGTLAPSNAGTMRGV